MLFFIWLPFLPRQAQAETNSKLARGGSTEDVRDDSGTVASTGRAPQVLQLILLFIFPVTSRELLFLATAIIIGQLGHDFNRRLVNVYRYYERCIILSSGWFLFGSSVAFSYFLVFSRTPKKNRSRTQRAPPPNSALKHRHRLVLISPNTILQTKKINALIQTQPHLISSSHTGHR